MIFSLLFLIFIFSISSIQASDINSTTLDSNNNNPMQLENSTQSINLESNDLDDVSLNETSKNKTEFTSPTSSMYYNGDYEVTLKDSNSSNTLPNKTVDFVINKVNCSIITNNNGVACLNLKLVPGKYVINTFFAGDDDYEPCNSTFTFKILPTIKANDMSKYYKGNTKYCATFLDSQGKALKNTMVTFTVNGKSYTKKTNNDGFASMSINLKPGTYKITSTDPITGYKLTTNFKILPTINSKNIKQVEGQNKKFKAKFLKNNGKALSNKKVKYKLKGKIHKVKTNSKGIVSLSLKKLKKGTYKIVCYNRDGLSKSYKIKIYKRKASTKITAHHSIFFQNESKQLKIKFSTALNDDSCSKQKIKIRINKKTYTKKTNDDGMIKFKLPSLKKGLYTVQYKYPGNKFFKESKLKKLVTIVDTSKTKLKVKSTKSFGYGAGTLLKVAYTAGGIPLAKHTVILKIDGKKYTKTTDNNGIASLPINLKIGKYDVIYKTNDESILKGTSGSFDINVFKRSPSKLVWKSGKTYKDSSQKFKVLLTNTKGKSISSQKIKLTIDSKTYSSKASSKGYAKFKTDVDLGKYKVSVKYNGNNNYLPTSLSKSINVKLSKFGNGLNEKNANGWSEYLQSSSHCQVGNHMIKSLVKSLTKGLTSEVDKAKAIFNYVRDELEYSNYYDTKYGAVGTLENKKGNCVDLSHALVAMFRTANLESRYVHGTCHFSKGYTVGHVWAQVKIGNTWVCADASNDINSLGKIKNWNINSYSLHAKYASLPF